MSGPLEGGDALALEINCGLEDPVTILEKNVGSANVEPVALIGVDENGGSVDSFGAVDCQIPGRIGSSRTGEGCPKLNTSWFCAICLDKIKVEETAQVKGCEHAYCVTCILRWAMYRADPWCPQCRLPFSSLYLYKTLDGSLCDYMCEESICLLLRATWFVPLPPAEEFEQEDDYHYQDDDIDVYEEEHFYTSSVRLGNRRWGDSGYVRAGRKEARPVGVRQVVASASSGRGEASGSSTRQSNKGKEPLKEAKGRRAKRAQKREAAAGKMTMAKEPAIG